MKKAIIASILGVMACAAVNTSYGDGYLYFANYTPGGQYTAPVTIKGGVFGNTPLALGSDFSAQLLYSATGTAGTFSAVDGATAQFYGTGLGDLVDGGGLFLDIAEDVIVPSYTSGDAFFEIYAYNTDTVDGFAAGSLFGTSKVTEVSRLATLENQLPVFDLFPDDLFIVTPLQAFSIIVVAPEPMTTALAGLGLVSLLTFRCRSSSVGRRWLGFLR